MKYLEIKVHKISRISLDLIKYHLEVVTIINL